jgi:hypothetical protein
MKKEICETCIYGKYGCTYMMGGNVKADFERKIIIECDNYKRDEGQDIRYFIHPEKWEMWLGNQVPTVDNTIIDMAELERLAAGWNKSIDELLEDVDELRGSEAQREIIAEYFGGDARGIF